MFVTRRLCIIFLNLVFFLPYQSVRGDEVTLQDGSHIQGEILKRKDGALEFKTSFAGVINIQWDEIRELRADTPMIIILKDESTILVEKLRNDGDGMVVIGVSGNPERIISQSMVAFINPEPWRTGTGYSLSGRVSIALEKERGNTDQEEVDIDGNLTWRYLQERVRVYAELEHDRNNNKNTQDMWRLDNHYEHFFNKKLFAGVLLGFEHDQFEDLDLRTTVGPLLGYQWFEGKDLNLSTSIGPIFVEERFDVAEDSKFTSLGWVLDFDQFLFERFVQAYHRHTGLWNLEHTNDVVWDTWTGLRFPLVFGFVASTEMQTEYNGGAAENAKKLDTSFNLKLGYRW